MRGTATLSGNTRALSLANAEQEQGAALGESGHHRGWEGIHALRVCLEPSSNGDWELLLGCWGPVLGVPVG